MPGLPHGGRAPEYTDGNENEMPYNNTPRFYNITLLSDLPYANHIYSFSTGEYAWSVKNDMLTIRILVGLSR